MISKQLLDQVNEQLDTSEQIIVQFQLDGTFYHFKHGRPEPSSSHIWAIGNTWEYKSNTYEYVQVGDWRTGEKFTVKSYNPDNESKAAIDYAKKHIEEVEKTKQEEKELRHTKCKDKWEPIFNDLYATSPLHGYLEQKKADSNHRARIRNENTLLIPIEHPQHGFVGVQQIFKQNGTFHKYFSKGIRITGSYTRVENFDIREENVIYLAEGYATAISVFMATGRPTVCCFNCNNIIPAISSIRSLNRSVKIIIAADDDHETIINGKPRNPGKYKAIQAARQFSNVIYKLPTFKNPANLSDFNDLHCTEGLKVVAEQLAYDASDFIEINPLGHKDGDYYYVNTQTNEIFSGSAGQHTPNFLLAQAPRSYWGQNYGFKLNKSGDPTRTPDWEQVVESLFKKQRLKGFFENEKVRGIGAWQDGENTVFNSGNFLYVNNNCYPISEHPLESEYIYEAKKNVPYDPEQIINQTELNSILDCFKLISYKNPSDYVYLTSTILLAQIPGLIDWRPHIWLTGCRGTGKTTILGWINDLIFNNGNNIVQDPTVAALRQMNQNDAVSVMIDEAEPNSRDSRKRLDAIMAMARQSSSRSNSKIIRGSATGQSVSYLINSLFIMGSIQPSINNAADLSRFTVIDLKQGSQENFNKLLSAAHYFPELKMKLLAYSVRNISRLRDNQKIIRSELLNFSNKIDARQADQISWQFAAFYLMKYGHPVETKTLNKLFVETDVANSEYIQVNQQTDEGECLSTILSQLTAERNSIAYCIKNEKTEELSVYGIRVEEKYSVNIFDVFFSPNNRNLKKALSDTEFQDYSKVLRRLPEVSRDNVQRRINGRNIRGFIMKLDFTDSQQEKPPSPDVPF